MKKLVLLIPVENQVRELDAKLLLACVAAKRNLTSIIGPKRKIENHIASFPRGIFLSKSLRIVKRKFFPISRLLGHEIVAWMRRPWSICRPKLIFRVDSHPWEWSMCPICLHGVKKMSNCGVNIPNYLPEFQFISPAIHGSTCCGRSCATSSRKRFVAFASAWGSSR